MDIGRSIQYVFQDPDWIKKVLIGGLLFLIPIIGWLIVAGYYVRNVQNVMNARDLPLPEWNDWGGDLARGLKLFVVYIVWLLPVWLLSCLLLLIAGFDDTGFTGLVFNCIIFILSLAITFLMPLFIGRYARREEIADAFQIGGIIEEAQRVPGQLLIYVVLSYVIGFVAFFGIILCFIGLLFTFFISYLITGNLVGQIRRMLDGEPAPATPATPV